MPNIQNNSNKQPGEALTHLPRPSVPARHGLKKKKKEKNGLGRLPCDPLCHVVAVLGSAIAAPATELCHCIRNTEMRRCHLVSAPQIHTEWVWYTGTCLHIYIYIYISKSIT